MPANRLMTLQVYPNAYHAFDVQGMRDHYKLGHMLAYDAAATTDAHVRVQAFLYQYLYGGTPNLPIKSLCCIAREPRQ